MGLGTYSDKDLREAIENGEITSQTEIDRAKQIQPSSLDLTLSGKIWRMPESALPSERMAEYLERRRDYTVQNRVEEPFLEKRVVYIAELNESLKLPSHVEGKSNPKSSTGRIDVHVRLLTDKGKYFDHVPAGYEGPLFLEIYSNTFDLVVRPGVSLNQLRLADEGSRNLDGQDIKALARRTPLVMNAGGIPLSIEDYVEGDSIGLSLNLKGERAAFVARHHAPKLDLSRTDQDPSAYFEIPRLTDEGLVINPGDFYILGTKEVVGIPSDHCGEMADIRTGSGEFRAHYAGFFDPAFKAVGVVEVRNHGPPFLLRDGQRIANLQFYTMRSMPERSYGSGIGSNYQGQGVKLAKFFKEYEKKP
jgi:dCTP deaminase